MERKKEKKYLKKSYFQNMQMIQIRKETMKEEEKKEKRKK